MDHFELVKALIGGNITEDDIKYMDCYVHDKMGLLIPSVGACGYAPRAFHPHPSYLFIIVFSPDCIKVTPSIEIKEKNYFATVLSPDIPHKNPDESFSHYYCLFIDQQYFEEQYRMYSDDKPYFHWKQFEVCHDILKALNTFAFEYSKKMQNSDVTLSAQTTIITHWLIRSILGENYDMRAISSNYSVARAEHYIEQHYHELITVKLLAQLGNMSETNFNRIFKKETGLTPIEYLIETRIQKSKLLLRRKEIPITEIALRCGFSSSSHFSSSFCRLHQVTPSEYRNSYY